MEITLAFYNVENLYDTKDDPEVKDREFTPTGELLWDDDKYERKLTNIAEVLHACGTNGRPPVFIGLCEVENRKVLRDLLHQRGLSDVSWGIAHRDSRDVRGIDVAFAFDVNFFELEGTEQLNFEDRSGVAFGARDILHVWGKLKDRAKTRMHFFVNHWPSRQGNAEENEFKRLAAASILRERIDLVQAKDPDAHIVAMGDFNDGPKAKSMNQILKAAENAHDPKALVNLGWPLVKKDKGTVYHEGDWFMFDSLLVSGNLLDQQSPYVKRGEMYIYDEGDVLFFEPRSHTGKPNRTYVGRKYKGGYSDHLAVYVRIRIETADED